MNSLESYSGILLEGAAYHYNITVEEAAEIVLSYSDETVEEFVNMTLPLDYIKSLLKDLPSPS